MNVPQDNARIDFAEWLPSGLMVRFANKESVFFSAEFLFAHRSEQLPVAEEIEAVEELQS